ncbi:MAG: aminotransferase class I/II-fold pyridoxal phosphate-dependent enzyme [Candidatus Methanomethylophilaceae archaeon]|nr:aminotransferase class I/II-fold pyridoxal phosphate-dependent enzyme [Candidatus Methanomethylophilaceae archaeon]MBO5668908.1 aminotransferase class I/II-fold pyridoxal phosphate-dependent enzyme [Candidatus Methanomethylophilaceae archaeon]
MKVSQRLNSIEMSGIRKMFDIASPTSINLGLGEPDLLPPKKAIDGMTLAAENGLNKYGPTAGIMELRESVAKKYSAYWSGLKANNVMITPSGSSALLEIAMTIIDPGDHILTPSPGFVIYGPHAKLAGGTFTDYKMSGPDFQPDLEDIKSKITPATKAIIVNNPSNPTGSILNEETFKGLLDIAEDNDLTIVSDEVYDSFIYEGKHLSFLPHLDRSIVVGGFSKMMAVTGWRMGFLMANEGIMEDLIKMQYHLCASPNMPAMYGALAAMPDIESYLKDARTIFKRRRDLIVERINEIEGMHIEAPKGAFYAFPSYDLDMKSADLAMELARNGLICTPGSAFGSYGEGHLRFSYAADETKISRGMDILAETYAKLRKE